MYCDYKMLTEEAIRLNKVFQSFNKIMSSIEKANKEICNNNHWSSQTRDYFYQKHLNLLENFDIVTNQFLNINQYLDNVIENYASAENSMSKAFSSFGE